MANMIPTTITEQTESGAERKLFPVFRGGLDDSYTVFHSFNLLTKNRKGKFIDGEIDFLVFSPDKGFLVIEAKSGAIRYDGSTGTWYQNEQPLKRSPFAQAVHAKYQLLYFLEAHLGYTLQATFAHAIFFPDVFTEIGALPSGGEPEISLTGWDMQNVGKRAADIFQSFQKEKTRPLNEKQVGDIRNVLIPYCEYGTSLTDQLGKVKQQIFVLTENQCHYLEFIRRHHWAKIEGCAGSGKTVMAVKKTRELAAEGKSVLLLAYNRMIGEHLTKSVADMKNVKASTYHKFCIEKLREAGWLKEQPSYDSDFFDKQVPELYAKLMDKQPVQYDAVIVDEG